MRLPVLLLLIFLPGICDAEWIIDLSRRNKEVRKQEYRPIQENSDGGVFDFILNSGEPIQEIVILNTDRGFVPSTVRTREGFQYKVHIVNVNEKDKNVSFVLDAFSEHHATYFGKIKTFMIHPQKEGIYTFQSPETSSQGRLVVYPTQKSQSGLSQRQPASER